MAPHGFHVKLQAASNAQASGRSWSNQATCDVWSRWVLYGCVMAGTCGLPLPPFKGWGLVGGGCGGSYEQWTSDQTAAPRKLGEAQLKIQARRPSHLPPIQMRSSPYRQHLEANFDTPRHTKQKRQTMSKKEKSCRHA